MSETPRTEAVVKKAVGPMREYAIIKHAQTLERELLKAERERDEARSLTEHQWLLKVGIRLFEAGCKSDGILDSIDEVIRERDEARELAEAYKEYAQLLGDEINDMVTLAHVHGWQSSRIEQGKVLREKIKQLEEKK